MMGRRLQIPSDEPDLIPAAGNTRVLVHGDHKAAGADVIGHAHNFPQQADLTAHRLLCGRPKERPVSQSESTTSSVSHTASQRSGFTVGHCLMRCLPDFNQCPLWLLLVLQLMVRSSWRLKADFYKDILISKKFP